MIACTLGLFGTVNAQETVTIGTRTQDNYSLPIEVYWSYSFSQQSYSKTEIAEAGGYAGTITSLAFKTADDEYSAGSRNLKVFLTNIDTENETTFAIANPYYNLSDLSGLVYEGTVNFVGSSWNTIEFQTPFVYNGNHLLVTVLDNTGSDQNDIYFEVHQKSAYDENGNAISWATNTGNHDGALDPTAMSQSTPNGVRNIIQFTFAAAGEGGEEPETPVDPEPETPTEPEQPAMKDIVIETGADKNPEVNYNYYLPVYDYASYAMSQQIYTAEELDGNIGLINSIAFKLGNNRSVATRQYEVYLTETDLSMFNGYDFVTLTAEDKVFDGDVEISGVKDSWYTINLDKAFDYQGGNIVLTVYDKTGYGLTSSYHTYYRYSATSRSLYKQGGAVLDMLNLTTGTAQSYVSQVQFGMSVSLELSVPQNLVATATGSSTIELSWKAIAVASSYNVYNGTELVANVEGPSCTVEGLDAETTYCFTVTAVNETGESDASAEVCATTAMPAPTAPTDLVATTNGETSVVLEWQGVETATSYNVYKGAELVANVEGTTYTVEGLSASTEYCFTVKSVNAGGESAASNEACATTEEFTGCYVNFTLTDQYGDSWDGCSLSVSYSGKTENLYCPSNPTNYTLAISQGTHVTVTYNMVAYPKEKGFTVTYESGEEILAVAQGTLSSTTSWEFDVDCTPKVPGTPVVTATTTSDATIVLAMEATSVETYTIYQNGELLVEGLATSTYTVEGLTPDTEYCFTAKAINEVGESELSEAVCARTYVEGSEIVQIGEGTGNVVSSPIYDYNSYSISQTIYTAEEIGYGKGIIKSVFYNQYAGGNNVRNISVYMKNTESTDLLSSWEILEAENLVYNGNFTFGKQGWVEIELQEQFAYEGGNVLVCVVDNTGYYPSSYQYDYFYTYMTGSPLRAIYGGSSSVIDPLNIDVTRYGLYDNSYNYLAPQVKFLLSPAETEEPTPDEPIVDAKYRLVSTGEGYNLVTYVYESETSDKVIEIREGQDSGYGQYIAFLQYDENGVLTGYEYGWAENGAINKSGYNYQYTAVVYTYTDGVVTSYTETEYTGWSEPYETAYTITRDAEGNITEVAYGSSKLAYTYENGKLVSKTKSYYDQWAETPGYVTESEIEYAYDENGNCTVATQYSEYDGEKVARKGTEYVYATTIAVENVVAFAYPEAVAPAHANLITKEISYEYNEDYNTGEIYKDYYTVTPYVYNPEVASEPLAPMALTVSAMSDTELRLSWVAVESAEKFYIYNGEELFAESESDVYYAEGLEANTEYCFSVSAVNGEFESPRSEVVCGKTLGLVAIYPTEIEFGEVRLGNYWAKEETVASVEIDPLGKTITSITCDNAFFTLPEFDATADYIVFDLGYDKTAEAGEYTGNIVVTLEGGVTVTAPVTATAYAPVTPDVFELAQEITFTEGVYTDTPDFATLHDDYLMPAEEEWNDGELMDAVYTFTLETPAVVTVKVEGENAQYAIYQAEGFEFPTEETFVGIDRAVSTAFSFDFNDGELDAFTIEDYDAYQDYSWDVEEDENGGYQLVSYSFQGWYGEDNSWQYYNDADERIITNAAFNITEKSVLTFDMNVNGNWEGVIIEVTKDGETFTEIENIVDQSYSYDWFAKRINIGEKLAALGLEYGEYRISLYHDLQGYGKLNIDNLVLSEREYAFPEGTYFLFAAAEDAFSVEVTAVETEEVVIVPEAKAYRLESVVNFMETVYTYDEVFTNRVVEMVEEGITTTLSYNKAGQVVSAEQVVEYEGEEGEQVEEVLSSIEYTYNEDGTLATYTETAPTQTGAMATTTTEYTYEDGRLAKVENADWEIEMTYVYNEDGTVKEIVEPYAKTLFTYEEGNLVKTTIGWDDEETGEFFVEAEEVYTYANGNVVKQESYEYGSLYQVHEFFYDATISAEDVYTFELPHMAIASVEPTSNNVLVKELSYYSYYDEEADETITHSYTMSVYNYNPAIEMAPVTPINFAATVVDGVVELTWEALADAESFTVYQEGEAIAENLTEGFYAVEGLAAGEYCFAVKAFNAAGSSKSTNEACVTIGDEPIVPEPTVPAAPVVRVKEVTATTVVLEWDAVEGATEYALYSAGEKLGTLAETIAGVQALEPETEYCFTVTAINEAGESEHSEEVCATTLKEEGIAENEAAFNIYPNPVVDRLVIETEATIEAVTIYTLTGVMIYSEVDFNNNTIDVTDFAGGVYVMKVRTENGEVVKRFIKK